MKRNTFAMQYRLSFRHIIIIIGLSAIFASCNQDGNIFPTLDDQYDQYGSPFDSVPETGNIVMYEINLRAYSAAGNIQSIIADLDRLKDMSVNTIWLMPIYDEGELMAVHSPYCIRDYYQVSDEYGSLQDLQQLTDAAHARNIAVVLDWVANHTSWDNGWITDHPDWYTQDADGNIIHPPGTTWTDVADLNFDNQDMRAQMIDAMKFWVLVGNVDGFRCDYADGVPFDFWQQALDSLRNIPDRTLIMLAEGDRDDHYTAGFDMTYAWDFYGTMQNVYSGSAVSDLYATNNAEYAGVPAGDKKLRFTTNHDESAWNATPMVLFNGIDGAVAASVMTIFLNGVPLIYTGQETGNTANVPFFSNAPINWTLNPEMQLEYKQILNAYSGHQTARTGTLTTFSNADVYCIKKTLASDQFVVLVNARSADVTYTLPTALKDTEWTDAINGNSVSLGTELALTPYQYLLLTNE